MKRFFEYGFIAAVPLLVSACGYVSEYERHVHDWEPTYCYQSIGGVQCYREPKFSDERRLVNYFGPHPSRYDKPEPPEKVQLKAPKQIDYWVKDPEPVPVANPPKKVVAATGKKSPESLLQQGASDETETSFLDDIRRTFFGKPTLANQPPQTVPAKPASNNTMLETPSGVL